MRDVLVVQNSRSGGPGRWGGWLEEAGLRLDVVHAYDGEPVPDRLRHDAMIMLGGGYLPGDDDRAPWLAPTRKLVAEALAAEVPLFGICLGGQMIAEVAGGEVTADAGAPENGSLPVTIRPEAADDPLFHDLPGVVPAIEHHVDAITALPPGAVWLAETARCPYQAFRVGGRAWGVQFHPEVPPGRIREWRADGFDPDEVYARAVADEPVSAPIWREVALRFAGLV
ncbi:type 1 glutamine amidotransferase [Nonomuraea ferruginea]|uniref:Type 1 glutamine amidotransferase n=1 Tax=Nonomuraea ferruginea TaxID=46174 RepID=A0ABT4T8M4_9ACTN|nr:type 1 glutamine amidotransferase [Nonomuraea ferruginea]MDA0645867.1 type 1 glutamine amidotransferase [Nonomuraea ferruginea]